MGYIDVGDNLWMFVTEIRYSLHRLDVGVRGLCSKILDVGDENDQNRHHYLKFVANTSGLQHSSPTSIKPQNHHLTAEFWPEISSFVRSFWNFWDCPLIDNDLHHIAMNNIFHAPSFAQCHNLENMIHFTIFARLRTES